MKNLLGILASFAVGVAVGALGFWLLFSPQPEKILVSQPPTPIMNVAAEKETPPSFPFSPLDQNGSETPPSDEGRTQSEPPHLPTPGSSSPEWKNNLIILRGRVIFGADGGPLPGIVVRILKGGKSYAECLTDGQGRFGMSLSGGGEWTVASFPFGDEGIRPGVKIEAEEGSEEFVEIIVPERVTYEVKGFVRGEEGKGIEGVKVEARFWGISPDLGRQKSQRAETVTGLDGHYHLLGIEIPLQRPSPRKPRSPGISGLFELDADSALSLGFGQQIFITFQHDEYASTAEMIKLSQPPSGPIRRDVTLFTPGLVSGIVEAPGGEPIDEGQLPYRIFDDHGSSGTVVDIKKNRFKIEIGEKGRLVIGGWVGPLWADDLDLGMVDRNTRKKGVKVRLKRLPMHSIPLLDQNGNPLHGSSLHIEASLEGEDSFLHDLVEVKSGAVIVHRAFKGSRFLSISGYGIVEKRIEIFPDNLPENIVLEVLPPLVMGEIVFPPGFDDWDEVTFDLLAEETDGGSSLSTWNLGELDRATGEFKIRKRSKHDSDAVFTVTINIPGYQPWTKKGIHFNKTGPMERVVVTFEK